MLVTAAVDLFMALFITICVVPLLMLAWYKGEADILDEADVEELDSFKWTRRSIVVFIVFPAWVMTMVGSEEIIKLNGLTPQTDLSQPGQSIPLAIGITVAVDGLTAAIKPGRKNEIRFLTDLSFEYTRNIYIWLEKVDGPSGK